MQPKLAQQKKMSVSLKNIDAPISNKQKKSKGSSSNITNLAAATHDNNTDSIVDQDDDIVLAGIPNHSFLSLQKFQGGLLDDDLNDDDNIIDNNDNHFGVEYNATVYDGRENFVDAVFVFRLSAQDACTRCSSLHIW